MPHDLTYNWNLMNKITNEKNRTRDMETSNRLKAVGGWGEWWNGGRGKD